MPRHSVRDQIPLGELPLLQDLINEDKKTQYQCFFAGPYWAARRRLGSEIFGASPNANSELSKLIRVLQILDQPDEGISPSAQT